MNFGNGSEEQQVISIYNYIKNSKPRFWVFFFVALLAIIAIYIVFTTYRLKTIQVTYNDEINQKAILYSIIPNETDRVLRPIYGNAFLIHRNTVAIRASTEDYTTIQDIGDESIGSDVVINLYKDRNAIKYSGDSLGCITYSQSNDSVLTYSCTNPRKLVSYSKTEKDKMPQNIPIATIVQPDSIAYSVKPYKGGVLGIRMPKFLGNVPTNRFLFATDSNGKTIEAAVPDDISQEQLNGTSVVTDTGSKANDSFLIINGSTGKIYYADNIDTSLMKYKEYTLPSDYSKDFDTLLCNLLEKTVYCFYGNNSDSPDSALEADYHNERKPASFVKIDFGTQEPNTEKFTTREDTTVDSLFVTNAGKLYAISSNSIGKVTKSGNVARMTTIIPDVRAASAGNGLYFVRNNTVYKYDDVTNESYAVFSSQKIKPANIINIQDEIFINGYIDSREGQRLHAYRLTDELNTSPGTRIIDLLPLGLNESSDVSDMDLFKSNLHVRLKVNISKTSGGAVDIQSFQEAQKRVLNLLQERSVNLNNLDITFSY